MVSGLNEYGAVILTGWKNHESARHSYFMQQKLLAFAASLPYI